MESMLTMKGITKIYGGVTALDHVDFSLRKGEIMALMGENGAGKSTLVKTLSGAVIPDAGTIEMDGKSYTELTPALSKSMGISIVYQELNLCAGLRVYENIFLGSFIGKAGFVNKKAMQQAAEKLLKENGLDIRANAKVGNLTVAQCQLVEIAKAISTDVKVLILDEPTGTLTLKETEILFALMRRLKEKGTTIIYISHRMSEIFEMADRVSIMRDGHMISVHDIQDLTEDTLIQGMIGRELKKEYPERIKKPGDVLLKVEHLTGEKAKDVSFELRRGEVLGIGGLVGAGRTELVRTLFGADPIYAGKIVLDGKEIHPHSPKEGVKEGISFVPEDRKGQGVVLGLPIINNVNLSVYKRDARACFVNRKKERETAEKMKEQLRIKTSGVGQLAGDLSGGNQQKVVLGKCLACQSKVLILDEPTRGIDVGAKYEFYKLINALAEEGLGILMVSSEMDELLGMSDRVLIMSEGRMTGSINREEFSQDRVLRMATASHQGTDGGKKNA